LKKTQVELQIEVALDAQAKEFREEIATIRADVTIAKKHGTFYEAMAQLGRVQGVCASAVQPPVFNGNTSWAMFRGQFETVAEHNCWTRQEKST
jgi:hypothetical protein